MESAAAASGNFSMNSTNFGFAITRMFGQNDKKWAKCQASSSISFGLKQNGLLNLIKGLFGTFRNPKAKSSFLGERIQNLNWKMYVDAKWPPDPLLKLV